ncbi:MAG: hydantoinase/oxoprolinase family protein, partial [Gammaproteobacteria bacterium]
RAIVKARSKAIAELQSGQEGTTLEQCKIHDSRYFYNGEWLDIIIYDRAKLHAGLVIPGPAIVVEMDSTTVVLPKHKASVDQQGNLIINPAE